MKKEFVPFETAKKLRAIGFDESCCAFYEEERVVTKPEMVDDKDQYRVSGWRTCKNSEVPTHYFAAATFSQAFRWFRERQGLHGIYTMGDDWNNYYWQVWRNDTMTKTYVCSSDYVYETYEEAELSCLDKLIELTFKSE